jgi:hypothetical protein
MYSKPTLLSSYAYAFFLFEVGGYFKTDTWLLARKTTTILETDYALTNAHLCPKHHTYTMVYALGYPLFEYLFEYLFGKNIHFLNNKFLLYKPYKKENV